MNLVLAVIGSVFLGALAYADDMTLLVPTPSAMRRLLIICDCLGTEFSVAFNASKSACVVVSGRKYCFDGVCSLRSVAVRFPLLNVYFHLGHHIFANLDDKSDKLSRSRSLCGKINNVLCQFSNCDLFAKLRLLRNFCCEFYGCTLWDLAHSSINDFCIAWRKGLKRMWSLPY